MGVSAVEHRLRTGLHVHRLAGKLRSSSGDRDRGLFASVFIRNLTAIHRQQTTKATLTDRPMTDNISSCVFIFFLYFYVVLQCAILGVSANLSKNNCSIQHVLYFSNSPHLEYIEKLRTLKNWAVILINFFLMNPTSRNSVLTCMYNTHKRNNSKQASTWTILIKRLQMSALLYITMLNLILIVLTNPCIVNPGPQAPNIKVSYCNAQGLIMMSSMRGRQPIFQTNKLLDFQSYIHLNKPDLVILNETWLNEYINTSEIVGEEYYKAFRQDRTAQDKEKYGKVGGGGVLILCRQDLEINITEIKMPTRLPIISVELKFRDMSKLCVSTYYRYGYSDHIDFADADKYYRELCNKYKDVILVGDLNLSTVKDWSCPDSRCELESLYIDLFSDLGLESLVNTSTHRAGNILDLLLTNRPSIIKNVSLVHDDLCPSDHLTIHFEIVKPRYKKKNVKRRVFSYKKANWTHVNRDLNALQWNRILSSTCMEENLSSFKSNIDIVLRRHIPMVTLKGKIQPPWFDSEMNELKSQKEMLRKRAKSINASPADENAFQNFAIHYKEMALLKKKEFITKVDPCEDANTVINKKFWSHVKNCSNSSRIPDSVYYNGRYRSLPADKSELYNSFFCAQFTDHSQYNIDITLGAPFTHNRNFELYFDPFTVEKLLKNVKPSKAAGPDGIDGHILKNCSYSLSYPLAILFSKCYNSSQIPQDWRNANVVPIHKKGDKANVENYRPISLTSLVMKLFEKCIREKVMELCQDKITEFQHGFLPNKSCTSQMLAFTCDLSVNLNNGLQTDIIYFDFAKAFDSVSHDIILEKLKHQYGVDGKLLSFILNYLKDRKQRVVIDGQFSTWQPVLSGVPQGSVLGPTLFVLFINDIVNVLSDDTKVLLYADDMKIWRKVDSAEDQTILQNDINRLYRWSVSNKMNFHPSKCKVVQSTLRHNILPSLYRMNNISLQVSEKETDLGVVITPKLLFNEHHRGIINKASQKLGLVKRNCSFTKCIASRKLLYLSLVRSLFEHCSQVWCPTNPTQVAKFVKIQKRAIKWIFNEPYCRYSEKDYLGKLKELNILPMDYKFQLNDLTIFHKIYHGKYSVGLPPFILKYTDMNDLNSAYFQRQTRTYNDSDRHKVKCILAPKVNSFKNSFFVRSARSWNSLPADIRSHDSIDSFKANLEKYFWNCLFPPD